jgi:hypothetical protein
MKKLIASTFLAALVAVALAAAPAGAAFSSATLVKASPEGVANAPAIFTYQTSDTAATVEAANYFQSASLGAGDLIVANTGSGSLLLRVLAATASTSTTEGVGGTWVCADGAGYGTTGGVARIASPIAGKVTEFYHTLTTVVDADVALNLDVGGTNMTGSATVAASGVAVGDVDSAAVPASNPATAGSLITVESDGGGTAGAGTTCIHIVP